MTTITSEHLELAAKAAGRHVFCIPDKATGELVVHHQPGAIWQLWRPHEDRADAWQLAADCGLVIDNYLHRIEFFLPSGATKLINFGSTAGITAAEAVTLAASEIGRAMG